VLVVGIVTPSSAASDAERNAPHLSRFSQRSDDEQASSASASVSLHSGHQSVARTTSSATHVSQVTTAASQSAVNSPPMSASATVVNYRYLAATGSSHTAAAPTDLSDLLSDDAILPELPPPLIPVPDRYQPLVDIETSESYGDKNRVPSGEHTNTLAFDVHQPRSPKSGECSVCMECEPNSALYPCGHMCMCYDCAVSVQKLRGALCPICRQPIIDILRIYRT